jgi:hypothetical protein
MPVKATRKRLTVQPWVNLLRSPVKAILKSGIVVEFRYALLLYIKNVHAKNSIILTFFSYNAIFRLWSNRNCL